MKKRVLSLFMAFVLCLTLLPTSAFAAGGTGTVRSGASGNVAKVGDTEYETLEEILDEMEPVEITLLGNVTEDLTVYATTTINMDGHSITGDIDAADSLTLTNGTVKGQVTVDASDGAFNLTAPADAEAAINGGLNVVSGSCNISGAKIGVKGTLTFGGDAMTITGTVKAVDGLTEAASSKPLYGSATVDGDTSAEAAFADGTYTVNGEAAKKLSSKKVGGAPEPAKPTLTITPETASTYNGQAVTFTGTYTGTGELNAYVQDDATNGYFTFDQVNNGDGTYTLSVTVDETAKARDYTLYVHEVGNSSVQAKATITVTAAVAKDDNGNFYPTIKDAIEQAPDGSTVTVIAAENQIQLPDGIYVDKTLTLDLNGRSLGGFPLNVGGYNRTGKLTVIDSSGGNGAVGVAVRDGGTLVFKPGNDHTTLLQLQAYGGTIQLYSGRILKSGWQPYNGVTLADLLPAEGGFAYYREGGAKLTIEQATSASYNLVVKSCDHGGTSGFAADADKCPDCGAPAVAYTGLNNVSGNPWRKFADLQTALDADRNGGSVVRLLADVSGNYNIDGNTTTGLDLNGHSINGTVTVKAADGLKDTTFSNSNSTGTGSIQTVVAFKGARLANSGSPAVIGTLKLATGATWANILQQDTLGYKVLNTEDGSYKWYAPSQVNAAELNNVIIGTLPVPSASLSFKVNDKTIYSGKVERGTTVQLCAYCNTSGADVDIYVGTPVGDGTYAYSQKEAEYKKIGTMWYYVVDFAADTIGTYSVYFEASKDGYSVTSSTKTLTVNKATIPNDEITAPTAKTLTYTGQPQELVTAGKLDAKYGTIQYSLSRSASSFSTTIPTKTDAGTYTVYYKVVGAEGYNDTATKPIRVTVSPIKIDRVMFSKDIVKTYSGSAEFSLTTAERYNCLQFYDGHNRLIDVPAGAYAIDGGVRFLAENAEGEFVDSPEAGTKSFVQFTVVLHNSNYVLQGPDDTEPASEWLCTQYGGANFTINKAKVTPADENVQLVFKDLVKTYEIDLSTFLPKLTPPCEYGDITYSDEFTVHFTNNDYYNYENGATLLDGILSLPIVAANSSRSGDEIGTVTVKVNTTNYEPFDLTIKLVAQDKLVPNSTGVTVSATEITYGQTLSESKLTPTGKMTHPGTGEEIKGTFAWKDGTIKPNAGNYEAQWTFTPDASYGGIYATATGKVTVTVNKAASSVTTAPTTKELTYNGSPQELVTAGTASGGAMKYSLSENGAFSETIPTATNAGTYTVYYMVEGDGNHNDTTAKSVTVTIAPQELTITGVTVADKTYDGTTAATITGVTFDGLQGSDTLTIGTDYTASGAFSDPNADFYNPVTATVTLADSVRNYTLADGAYQKSGARIQKATVAEPGPKTFTIINGVAKSYTVKLPDLPQLESPKTYGDYTYLIPSVTMTAAGYKGTATVNQAAEKELTLTITSTGSTVSTVGKATVTVRSDNYKDITLTVLIYAMDQMTLTGEPTLTPNTITYGETLRKITLTGEMHNKVGTAVSGTFTWNAPDTMPNAGTYSAPWTFTPAAQYDDRYAVATGSASVTVLPATLSGVSVQQDGTLTYNGAEQTARVTTAATSVNGQQVTFTYSATQNGDYTAAVPAFTNAGQHTVYYKAAADNHKTFSGSFTVTIEPKELDHVTIELSSNQFIYTGSGIEPTVTVKDGETVIPASQYTVSYKDNTDVGTATVTVTSKDNGNYVFSGSTTFKIDEANSSVTTAPTAKELTYTGSAQELVTAGTASGGTMKYRLGTSGEFSTEIPTAINAGTYTVYYMVQGDSNHNSTAAQSVEVIIKAKTVSEPTIIVEDGPFIYASKEIKPTVTVKDGETVIPASQYTVSYKDNTNVGTATVTVTSKDNSNYVFTGSTTFKIDEANSSVTTAPTAKELTYTGSAQELVTAGTASGGTMKYRLGDSGEFSADIPTAINAGTYTVYYMVQGDSNHKDTAAQNVTVIIKAKTVSEPTITVNGGPFVYTGSEIKPEVTVKDGETVIPASQYTVSYKDNTDVGTATVTVTSKDNGNYVFTGSTTFKIDEANSSVTTAPKANDLTYTGSAQELVKAGAASGGTMKYRLGDSGEFSTDIPTAINAGTYTVYYMVAGDNNHKDTAAQSVEVIIKAKTVSEPTIIVEDGPFTYTGNEIKPTVTVKDGETVIPASQYTVSYKDNTNVGTATVTVTSKENVNYVFTGSTTFKIDEANSSVTTAPTANDLTYNGSAQELVAAGAASGGTMKYRLGTSGEFSADIPTAINAGTYTVSYMVQGDSNHKDTAAQSVEVIIAKANLADVSVQQDGTLVYNGKEQTATVITAASAYGENEVTFTFSAEENGSYTDAVPAFINAGTYTVYYKTAADNHETASGSFTVTIEKATLENVSVSQRNELTYNGGQQTVEVDTSATTVDGSAVTFTYSMKQDGAYGDLPAFTNAGSFTVWYKVEADNHETFIGSFTVAIEKATVTVTALDKSAYVGSKAPDLSNPVEDTDYTVSDLFGDDQLTGTIKLAYVDDDGNEIVPSTSNSGEFIIRASGLTAPNENYAVLFVDGTLTVSRRPSSGGSSRSDYVIKVVAGEGGSISPSGDVGVRKGEDLAFTITPNDGYAVADIKIDGKSIGAARSYTFKDINASHTIEVSFVKAIGAPLTGDSSNMPLWIALLFASVCGLTGTTLCKRRKRTQ